MDDAISKVMMELHCKLHVGGCSHAFKFIIEEDPKELHAVAILCGINLPACWPADNI